MSLAAVPVGPVVPVSDLAVARAFYEDRLGLAGAESPGGYVLRAGEGSAIYLLPVEDHGGPSPWPIGSFEVGDLAVTVDALTERGVDFHSIGEGVPFDTDERGIAQQEGMAVAWFADPDGNVLTVFSLTD